MEIMIGYEPHARMGDPTMVEYPEGTPIRFVRRDIEVSFKDGILSVRATGTANLTIFPTSANAVEIIPRDRDELWPPL